MYDMNDGFGVCGCDDGVEMHDEKHGVHDDGG